MTLENPPHAPIIEGNEPLSKALRHLRQASDGETHLSVGDLLKAVGSEGPSLAAALLTLPFLQPIPLLGLSTPVGFAISFLGLSLLLQRDVKLPRRLSDVKLPVHIVLKTIDYLRNFEIKLKPYLNSDSAFDSIPHRRFLGGAIAVHAFLLALPLPIPFSNMIPAWLCFIASLTVLFASRRLYVLSISIMLINAVFWATIAIGAAKGSSSLVKWLGSLF